MTLPFVETAKTEKKGIFILVRTSNPNSEQIQGVKTPSGQTLSEYIAGYVKNYAQDYLGEYGYSPIGAVVGATFPEEAYELRQLMPNSLFLVPGFGAQGATAKDIVPCFSEQGLGALVSASRSITFAYEKDYEPDECTKEQFIASTERAVIAMKADIYATLSAACGCMAY